ncbi:MAG TPA: S26 family signal peptidase [Anaerolineaceae bacterium]|nr:S26 family signal peptidase [Anaerolineaceae bacterium]
MVKLLKVSGVSLEPDYQDGDFVLISKIPIIFKYVRAGDVIVFHHEVYGTLIKRIARLVSDQNGYYVLGTHRDSIDSRLIGTIATKDVLGKVIWHISKTSK